MIVDTSQSEEHAAEDILCTLLQCEDTGPYIFLAAADLLKTLGVSILPIWRKQYASGIFAQPLRFVVAKESMQFCKEP